jgi:hypothetical protein
MPLILLLVPVLELLGLLGFVYLASSTVDPNLRYLPLMVAGGAVVFLFAREAGAMTLRQLAIAVALLSVLAGGVFQVLGLVYPGLAKDVDHISFGNVMRLAVVSGMAFVVHGGLLALCHLLRGRLR